MYNRLLLVLLEIRASYFHFERFRTFSYSLGKPDLLHFNKLHICQNRFEEYQEIKNVAIFVIKKLYPKLEQ